jgi:hypothetical protein
MSEINLKPSQRVGILTAIDPVSSAALKTSAWVDATLYHNILALIDVGVIAATGTLDAKLQQATDNAGTGAKDIAGKAIVQMTQAAGAGNQQALINLKQEELDINNGFKFVALKITPAVAASLISGALLGFDPRYGSASDTVNENATVVQVI